MIVTPGLGKPGQEDPWVSGPASLAEPADKSEKFRLKNQGGEGLRKTSGTDLWPIHAYVYAHTQVAMHKNDKISEFGRLLDKVWAAVKSWVFFFFNVLIVIISTNYGSILRGSPHIALTDHKLPMWTGLALNSQDPPDTASMYGITDVCHHVFTFRSKLACY